MNFFTRIGKNLASVWHHVPVAERHAIHDALQNEAHNEAARLIAKELPHLEKAIDKSTHSSIGTLAGTVAQAELGGQKPQNDAAATSPSAQVNRALQGGQE